MTRINPRQRAAAFLSAALLTLAASPAMGGIITGQVTNPNSMGVPNVELTFFDVNLDVEIFPANAITDAFGNYTVLVPDGLYIVEYITPVVTGGLAPATILDLTITGILTQNMQLEWGVVLTGTVTDTLGLPASLVDLNVTNQTTGGLDFTPNDNTNLLGVYAVIVVPGPKDLRFGAPVGSRLAASIIPDVNLVNDTTINLALIAGFFVSGTAMDPLVQPVKGADLDFDESSTGIRIPTPGDKTDNGGIYQVTVPPGTYDITIEPDPNDQLLAQRIFGVPITKDTIINWSLVAGLSLSGNVTGPGGPVPNCDIDVVDHFTLVKLVTPADRTDEFGDYEVIIPAGTYDVRFQPDATTGLVSSIVENVVVTVDQVVNGTVTAGVTLDGIVQSSGGALVANVDLDVFYSATGATVIVPDDITDAAGYYAMALAPNTYDLEFEPAKSRRLISARVDGYPLTGNQTLGMVLDTGLSISGTITAGGLPLDSVDVDAIRENTGASTFQYGERSDLLGGYEIIVRFEPHTIAFLPPLGTGRAGVAFAGVNPGVDLVLDVDLPIGVLVSGTVTVVGGGTVAGVVLRAESGGNWAPTTNGLTDGVGFYQTRLANGTYDLTYLPPPGSGADPLTLTGVVISGDTPINVELPEATCNCPSQGDIAPIVTQGDGAYDVLDVVAIIDEVFRSGAATHQDAGCPNARGDLAPFPTCGDGGRDVLDVVFFIDLVFRSGPAPCNPCAP